MVHQAKIRWNLRDFCVPVCVQVFQINYNTGYETHHGLLQASFPICKTEERSRTGGA